MRFAVLGAGAIGAYVGAALSRGGADVTLIARGAHLRAMQQNGVVVHSARGDFTAHPAATDDWAALAEADVIVCGLKAYSLPEIAGRLGELLKPDASVVFAQNGIPWWYFHGEGGKFDGRDLASVDPGVAIADAIPDEHVVGCVVYCSTEITAPGVITHGEGTRFSLGTTTGEANERVEAIAEAFKAGGLKAPVDPELRAQIWLKVVGNMCFNPLSVVLGATLGAMGTSQHARELAFEVMSEGAAVAEALGVTLPVSLERRLQAGFDVGDHKTSMLQDYEAQKPLELDCMTGAVIEIAGMVGAEVPATRELDRVVRARVELR